MVWVWENSRQTLAVLLCFPQTQTIRSIDFIESQTNNEMTSKNFPPLYGLVLAGGRSRRMGRDKAALAYHDGVPHLRRTADLLAGTCERVFVSCRKDQENDPLLASLPESVGRIPDTFDIGGPLNGILSALDAHPGAAFLVAACDLTFLSAEALSVLVSGRDPSKPLTAFENPARENFLEPLCAIYEPQSLSLIRSCVADGMHCPRKILLRSDTQLLELPDPHSLDNVNTPEDLRLAAGRTAS
jgi:molybdopterin-guanine dinucleotide biosynthesis protein A